MQVDDLEAALQPTVDRILAHPTPLGLVESNKLHNKLLAAFGDASGTGFLAIQREAPTDRSWLYVGGILGYRLRPRDIHLRLEQRGLKDRDTALVCTIDDLYLPRHAQGCGAGTALLRALMVLWARTGVADVTATACRDGSCAFASWGFELDPENSLTPANEVQANLRARCGLDGSPDPPLQPPPELVATLQRLLSIGPANAPVLDMNAVYALTSGDGDRYGQRLLHGVMWPARRRIERSWGGGLDLVNL